MHLATQDAHLLNLLYYIFCKPNTPFEQTTTCQEIEWNCLQGEAKTLPKLFFLEIF
jgi:hypothetical protein